jgi:anti-anti-sigma factor
MPETTPQVPVVAPTGALDLTGARGLGSRLAELAGTSGGAVLDLSGVEVIDSIGLGVVLKAASRFHRQGKRLVLVVEPESPVDRLLELAGTRGRLAVAASRHDAVDRVHAAR